MHGDQEDELAEVIKQITALQEDWDAIRTGVADLQDVVDEVVQGVGERIDSLGQQAEGLREGVEQLGGTAISCREDVCAAVEVVEAEIRDALERMVAMWAEALEEATEALVEDALAKLRDEIADGLDSLKEALLEAGVGDKLQAGLDSLVRAAFAEMQRKLEQLLDLVRDGFARLRSIVSGEQDQSAHARESGSSETEILDQLMSPIRDAIERVMGLARMVGL